MIALQLKTSGKNPVEKNIRKNISILKNAEKVRRNWILLQNTSSNQEKGQWELDGSTEVDSFQEKHAWIKKRIFLLTNQALNGCSLVDSLPEKLLEIKETK